VEKRDNAEKVQKQMAETKGKITDVKDVVEATADELPEIEEDTVGAKEPEANALDGVSAEQIALIIQKYEDQKQSEANKEPEDEPPEVVGRELIMVSDKRYGMVVFKRKGGGKIPKILQGHWMQADAERSLELYKAGALKPQTLQVTNTHAIKSDKKAS
jgi:hypothetical protein